MQWYMVQVVVGREAQALQALQTKIKQTKNEAHFKEVLVPEQRSVQIKDGISKEVKERLFPGYLLVQMDLQPTTEVLVKNASPLVKDFVRAGKRPCVFSQAEADKMLQRLNTVVTQKEEASSFVDGDRVKIVAGPFNGFLGKVDSSQGHKVKVMVEVFGRATSVELGPQDLEKVQPEKKQKAG